LTFKTKSNVDAHVLHKVNLQQVNFARQDETQCLRKYFIVTPIMYGKV